MGEALRLWIEQDGWASLKLRPLTDTHREYPTGQGSIMHPAAPGRLYAGGVRLDGPVEVTREEWLEAIAYAVAEAEENHRRNPPKLGNTRCAENTGRAGGRTTMLGSMVLNCESPLRNGSTTRSAD